MGFLGPITNTGTRGAISLGVSIVLAGSVGSGWRRNAERLALDRAACTGGRNRVLGHFASAKSEARLDGKFAGCYAHDAALAVG